MDDSEYLAALARDGAALLDASEAAGMDAEVVACPGWTVADLVWHIAEVYYFWRTMVGEQRTTWEGYEPPLRPADGDVISFARSELTAAIELLTATDPTQANWTWTNDHTAGWVIRRMAHETAVHRWDAEQAAGRDTPIDAALASDGIDEFLTWFIGDPLPDAELVAGSVHIHCGDIAGEWTLRPIATGFDLTREHAKGDCAIRGGASDILLALWRRQPLSRVDVVGDTELAARFIARPSLA